MNRVPPVPRFSGPGQPRSHLPDPHQNFRRQAASNCTRRVASISTSTRSRVSSASCTSCSMRRSSCEAGLCTPGVSTKTICAAGCTPFSRRHLHHPDDAIARRLRLGRDNSHLLARKGVQQRAFAHIGPAQNCNESRFQTSRSPFLLSRTDRSNAAAERQNATASVPHPFPRILRERVGKRNPVELPNR